MQKSRVSKLKYKVIPIESRMVFLQDLSWAKTKITTEVDSNGDCSRYVDAHFREC